METITLEAQVRDRGLNVRDLRKSGNVPCVVYGNTENTLLSCKTQEVLKAYTKAGENTVIELKIDGKAIPVLFHATQFDPVSDKFDHVDFFALDMTKKVTTHIPVHAEGESPAVKSLSGILVTVSGEVTVTCLPKDLPHEFTVSLATLENFGDTITVADLKVPANVEIKEEDSQVLFTVQEPRAEAEPEPAAEGAEGTEGTEAAEGADGDKAAEGEEKKPAEDAKNKKE